MVPSPKPIGIVEFSGIRRLVFGGENQAEVVIASGGGGIPVIERDGAYLGVDAVVDKDRASVLLAQRLAADILVFSTGAEHVYLNYRRPNQRALIRAGVTEMKDYLKAGQFPTGSMGPKIEAAIRFLESGGKRVIITSDEHLVDAVHGSAGTHIVPDPGDPD